MKLLGIILTITGILIMAFTNSSTANEKGKIIELAKTDKQNNGWSLYAGGIAAFCGLVVIIATPKKK